jgi:hypothetical protein
MSDFPKLEPDRGQIEIFVEALFRHAASGAFLSLRSFHETRSDGVFAIDPLKLNGNFQYLCDVITNAARMAANAEKKIVFAPPIATFKTSHSAAEDNIAEGLVLSVECDANPQQGRERLESLLGPATVVVRSGGRWRNSNGDEEPKLHLHWRLSTPAADKRTRDRLKCARELAARLVGADTTGAPVSHCYRWPGSWHRKASPRLCSIEAADPDRELALDHALDLLKEAAGAVDDQPDKPPKDDGPRLEWASAFKDILSGEKYHPALAPLASSFASRGAPEPVTDRVLRALMANSAPADPERVRRRDIEIKKLPETISSAYKKFTAPATLFDPWAEYPVPDFPVEILPFIAQDFVKTQSVVIGCDISGMAMAVLATFSGALSHRFALRMMRNGSWWENPRIWALLVGDPSTKKTPEINAATRPLEEHQNRILRQYQERLREYEAAKNAKEANDADKPKPPPRHVVFDTTIEKLGDILARSPKGLLVKRDEFAGWIGGMEKYAGSRGAAADRGFWLKAFDGGPYSVDRVSRGETYIENLSVTLIGGIQPARLAELHGLTSDGLLQRFLPVVLGPSRLALDQPSDEENYGNLVRKLIFAKPERLIFSDAALKVMQSLRQELHEFETVSAGLTNGFQAFIGKLPGYAGRVALILHMAADPERGGTYDVDETTVKNVRRLIIEFIVPHAAVFYRAAESTTDSDRLRTLASWILTSGKPRIVASDLIKNVWDLRGLTVFDLNKRVSPLVAGGWLEPAEAGPTCRAWTVNPAASTLYEERKRQENDRKETLRRIMSKAFAFRAQRGKSAA